MILFKNLLNGPKGNELYNVKFSGLELFKDFSSKKQRYRLSFYGSDGKTGSIEFDHSDGKELFKVLAKHFSEETPPISEQTPIVSYDDVTVKKNITWEDVIKAANKK